MANLGFWSSTRCTDCECQDSLSSMKLAQCQCNVAKILTDWNCLCEGASILFNRIFHVNSVCISFFVTFTVTFAAFVSKPSQHSWWCPMSHRWCDDAAGTLRSEEAPWCLSIWFHAGWLSPPHKETFSKNQQGSPRIIFSADSLWTPFFMLESKHPSDCPCNWRLAKDGVERRLCKAVGLPHHGRIMWVSTEKNNCVEEGFFVKKGEGTHKSFEDSRRPPVTWFQSRLGSWKFEFSTNTFDIWHFFLDFQAVKPPADVGSAGNTGGSGQVRNLGHGGH